jgi:DNA-binding XRE family transcriptional regulator
MTNTQALVNGKYEARRALKPLTKTQVVVALDISSVRKLLGFTQAQLAQTLSVTAPYLSMIENGRRQPSDDLLARIQNLILSKAGVR